MVKAAKRKWVNNFLHDATPERLWSAARWHLGRRQRLIPALTTASGLSDEPPRMAEALQACFFKLHPHPVTESFPDDLLPARPRPFSPISTAEIADCLQPTSNKSTPGPSGHNYKLVKWMFATQAECLTWIFNVCISQGYHPKAWRTAAITIVPKPGKEDYSLPKCYHPIALLECLGKLLEKVITKRLSYDITSLSLIPTTQFSACPHSSTVDAGLCLTHNVETAHALGSVYGMILFDIQGFFDNVNHARLIALVCSLGFPPEICGWITSFLHNRTVHLRFNNFTSEEINLELGTPQGSPLSPILSVIYASPLLHLAKTWESTMLSMFIDDGNILAHGPSYAILAMCLHNFYTSCHGWCMCAGLTIEPEKTEVLFFTRCCPRPNLHRVHPDALYLPNWEHSTYILVKSADHVCYLGFHFDHKLLWDKHIAAVSAQTKSTIKALQLLGNSVRGLDFINWCMAYNAICIPALTYGALI
jgi:Reverse transcriptase (RNA-dependent DNA polymerase)